MRRFHVFGLDWIGFGSVLHTVQTVRSKLSSLEVRIYVPRFPPGARGLVVDGILSPDHSPPTIELHVVPQGYM